MFIWAHLIESAPSCIVELICMCLFWHAYTVAVHNGFCMYHLLYKTCLTYHTWIRNIYCEPCLKVMMEQWPPLDGVITESEDKTFKIWPVQGTELALVLVIYRYPITKKYLFYLLFLLSTAPGDSSWQLLCSLFSINSWCCWQKQTRQFKKQTFAVFC